MMQLEAYLQFTGAKVLAGLLLAGALCAVDSLLNRRRWRV